MFDELVKLALVGTGREAPRLPADVDAPLAEALAALPDTSPESKLLGAITLASAYARSGRLPAAAADHRPDPCAEDDLAPCSVLAGQILAMLLADSGSTAKRHLIGEWLTHAARTRRRAPHRLLPRLLDYAESHRDARPTITQVAGARGAWLTRLNPRWQFAPTATVSASADPAAAWETGNRDERLATLRQLRQTDPARAGDVIRSTWDQDPADDRALFVEALKPGLSAADEPFLEFALDDKSKRVRAAAAELLATLPASAFVARMIARAAALLHYVPAASRSKRARIDVTLPPEPWDDARARDARGEKTTQKIGRRQWWLLQIVSFVSPAAWTTLWKLSPAECLAAATASEHRDVLLRAWQQSAARSADASWIRPMVLAALADNTRPQALALLQSLDRPAQSQFLAELLEPPRAPFETLVQILNYTTADLDPRAAAAAVARVGAHVSSRPAGYDYALPAVLEQLSLRLPPDMHDYLAGAWAGDKWEPNRKALDSFFHVLSLRRDLKREFTP